MQQARAVGIFCLALLGLTQAQPTSPGLAQRDSTLPLPTRYITANDDNGGSYFYSKVDTSVAVTFQFGNTGSSESLAYTNDRAPAQLSDNADIEEYKTTLANGPSPQLYRDDGGANVWFIDIPPSGISPFHRTISIDYNVIVAGSVNLHTTDGDMRTLNTGDMVINRAVEHQWVNPSSTDPCRIMSVATHVQPVVTKNNGTLSDD